MSIKKTESETGKKYSISDIDEHDLKCIYNSLTVAHLPDKQYLASLIKDIKQFL